MAKIILHQDWSSKHLFSSFLEIWEARLSHLIMGGNGWFDVALGRGLGSFPTLCQKGHTRRKSQGNCCKARPHPNETPHILLLRCSTVPLQLIRIAESDTPFRVCECAQSYVTAWFRNLKACGGLGFGVRGFHDTWWCNPVTLPVLTVNQPAWRSQGLWEGHFPSISVPAGLTVGFLAAGKHILLHFHSGRGIVIFLFFSRVPADAVVWWRFVSQVTIPA